MCICYVVSSQKYYYSLVKGADSRKRKRHEEIGLGSTGEIYSLKYRFKKAFSLSIDYQCNMTQTSKYVKKKHMEENYIYINPLLNLKS